MRAIMSVRELAEDQPSHQQNHHSPTIQGRCLHACTVARCAHGCNLSYLMWVLVRWRTCYLARMKFIALLSLILTTTVALSQDRDQETQVVQADAQLNASIKQNEAAKAAAFYADDFILTTSSGKQKIKSDLLGEIGSPDLKLAINETENVKVRVLNSTAVLTGRLHQKGSYKGQAFDVFVLVTDTWVKTATGWRLLAGHATLLPKS
jgi:ketosteroid isomerase-like protein